MAVELDFFYIFWCNVAATRSVIFTILTKEAIPSTSKMAFSPTTMVSKPRHYLSIPYRSLAAGNEVALEAMAKWAVDGFKLSRTSYQPTVYRIPKNQSEMNATSVAKGRKKPLRLVFLAFDRTLAGWINDINSQRVESFEMAIVARATKMLVGVNGALPANQQLLHTFSAGCLKGSKMWHCDRAFIWRSESGDADEVINEEQLPAIKGMISKLMLIDVFTAD